MFGFEKDAAAQFSIHSHPRGRGPNETVAFTSKYEENGSGRQMTVLGLLASNINTICNQAMQNIFGDRGLNCGEVIERPPLQDERIVVVFRNAEDRSRTLSLQNRLSKRFSIVAMCGGPGRLESFLEFSALDGGHTEILYGDVDRNCAMLQLDNQGAGSVYTNCLGNILDERKIVFGADGRVAKYVQKEKMEMFFQLLASASVCSKVSFDFANPESYLFC